ncbi:unnamed protein product [Cuscuta epithymum]|uniref:Uncharacterized protein n=1 Tax=Cuscuta epithymum TaxID=186058 RepID=A0AAV0DJN1_9ASTE|nr:unnamed protein product [Cuscuta epithymum]
MATSSSLRKVSAPDLAGDSPVPSVARSNNISNKDDVFKRPAVRYSSVHERRPERPGGGGGLFSFRSFLRSCSETRTSLGLLSPSASDDLVSSPCWRRQYAMSGQGSVPSLSGDIKDRDDLSVPSLSGINDLPPLSPHLTPGCMI